MKPMHSTGTAARLLGLSVARIQQLDAELGTVRDLAGRRLIPAEAVDAMIAKRAAKVAAKRVGAMSKKAKRT